MHCGNARSDERLRQVSRRWQQRVANDLNVPSISDEDAVCMRGIDDVVLDPDIREFDRCSVCIGTASTAKNALNPTPRTLQ